MRWLSLLVIALAVTAAQALATALVFESLPDQMVTHRNALGEADGWSPKAFGAWLIPGITLVLLVGLTFLPRLDPLWRDDRAFGVLYGALVVGLGAFLSYMQAIVLGTGLGWNLDFNAAVTPAIAGLFILLGFLLRRAPQNWFVGIRTPWTLSDATVWKKTHELSSVLFIGAGVVILLGLLWPRATVALTLVGVTIAAAAPVVYSFVLYKRRVPPPA